MAMQLTMFMGSEPKRIGKPVRLIELFAGYGSQAFALEYLGVNFESWRICEWAVKSIQAYKDAHCAEDCTDYSESLTDEEILNYLTAKGISADYNKPMTREQIKRLGAQKQRQIYNNIIATHNLVNIQQVRAADLGITETDKYEYVMTYSFPCQDLSKAGLGKGMEKGSGTRSGMLWEVERILDECEELPQVLLMENVPDVIGVNNIKHFADWLAKLESLGYHCYWQVLNGKDFGVPQNRERCFMVSLLGDYYYAFPEAIKLERRLKDLLEDEVDEKYYLSDKIVNYYENHSKEAEKRGNGFRFNPFVKTDVVAKTITTRAGSRMDDNFIEEPKVLAGIGEKKSNGGTQWYQQDRIYDDNIAISVTTSFNPWYATEKKENLKTQLCNDLVESGLLEENYVINHSYTNGGNCKNRNSRQSLEDYIETTDNTMPTLTTRVDCLGVVVNSNNKRLKSLVDKMDLTKDNQFMDAYNQTTNENAGTITARINDANHFVYKDYRIRKLTPKECFRLMGVKDKDFERIAKNQSNMSLYHLAGDSIIVDVLMAIFRNMIEE